MLKLSYFLCCFVVDVVLEAKSSFVPPSSFRTVHAISMHGGVNPGYFIHHQGFTGALYFIKCKFILYRQPRFRKKLLCFIRIKFRFYTPTGFTGALHFMKCKFILYTSPGVTGYLYFIKSVNLYFIQHWGFTGSLIFHTLYNNRYPQKD